MRRITYQIGIWSSGIIGGLAHMSLEIWLPKPPEISTGLEGLIVNLPAKETNMFDLTFGISLLMGLMLFAYGVLNLLILQHYKKNLPPNSLVLWNLLISGLGFFISLQYLFIAPTFLLGLSFVAYLITTVMLFKQQNIIKTTI